MKVLFRSCAHRLLCLSPKVFKVVVNIFPGYDNHVRVEAEYSTLHALDWRSSQDW